MHVLYIGETAKTQWQNEYDDELDVVCPDKQGFYRVVSQYDGTTRDRQWQWDCREVTKTTTANCFWTEDWENWFHRPFFFRCPANYILTGVNSIHHNAYEDRRWKFHCCDAENHFTKNCFATDYMNNWYENIDYTVDQSYVLTGVFSFALDNEQ